jgi:hypothetical protein
VNRSAEAAFSALRDLDPVAPTAGGWACRTSAHANVETEIARILARPEGHSSLGATHDGGRWADPRSRSRYGTLGLVASAALTVIATLAWVSPSAGAPLHTADPASGQVVRIPASAPGHLGVGAGRPWSKETAVVAQ